MSWKFLEMGPSSFSFRNLNEKRDIWLSGKNPKYFVLLLVNLVQLTLCSGMN